MLTVRQQDDFRKVNRDLQETNLSFIMGKLTETEYDAKMADIAAQMKTLRRSIGRNKE